MLLIIHRGWVSTLYPCFWHDMLILKSLDFLDKSSITSITWQKFFNKFHLATNFLFINTSDARCIIALSVARSFAVGASSISTSGFSILRLDRSLSSASDIRSNSDSSFAFSETTLYDSRNSERSASCWCAQKRLEPLRWTQRKNLNGSSISS